MFQYNRGYILKSVFLAAFLLLFFFAFPAFAQDIALPEFKGYVNDYEGIVENVGELEQKISNFEKETGFEIAVLTTPDFGNTYLEDYAVKVFEKWGLGKEDLDNGVLILVSKEQRQSRIEVGYGLEPVLTDGLTGRIQDVAMIPSFREEKYSEGINAGVAMIMEILSGEDIADVTDVEESDDVAGFFVLGIFFLGFLLLIQNPFVAAAIGGVVGFLVGTAFFGVGIGAILGVVGAGIGFVLGLISKRIPTPVKQGILTAMIFSGRGGRAGGGGGSSFGGFGGGSSGGGGSSRSW